jgi:hypothetical protein
VNSALAARSSLLALFLSLALACRGDIKSGPSVGPSSIELVEGDHQTAAAGTAVPVAPRVLVMGENGLPLAAVTVRFAADGGGMLTRDDVATNADGIASTGWILGPTAGANTLTATVAGLSGAAVRFTATAVAGPAARFSVSTAVPTAAGNDQPFSPQPVFQLQDAFGNAITGQVITVSAALSGGPPGAVLSGATAASDIKGRIGFDGLTLTGSVGQYGLVFQSPALPDVNATIRLDPGPSTRLTITTQPADSAWSGVALTRQPVIQLADVSGNDVHLTGVVVTASLATGGGVLSGRDTSVSNPDGVEHFSDLALVGVPGPRTLRFSALGLTSAVSDTILLRPAPASVLGKLRGDGQSAVTGTAVSTDPAVLVRDDAGNPVAGVTVTFTPGPGSGSVAQATTVSDVQGIATSGRWLLGGVGTNTLVAASPGLTGSPAVFSATATPGSPAALLRLGGNNQTGTAGAALPESLVVRLVDALGNGIAGRTLTWSGDGELSPSSSVTDAAGRGAARWTLGAGAGSQAASVTAAGFIINFAATAVPGVPGSIVILAGDGQSAVAGSALAESLMVRVSDANGNGVAGRTVSWTTTSGTASPSSVVTDAAGRAAARWTLGPAAGVQSLTASSPGLVSAAVFTAVGLPGAAAGLVKISGDSQAAGAGAALAESLVVRVVDANGNGVSGRTVQWSTGSGVLQPPMSVTGQAGRAATLWTLGPAAGSQFATASSPGVPGSIVFGAQATSGIPSSLAKVQGDAQTATAGTAVAESLVVRLVDANGNGVAGSPVTWTPAAGTVAPAGTMTDAAGRAAVRWTLGPGAGAQSVAVSAAGFSVTFTATAVAGAPGSLVAVSGGNQSGTVGAVLPESLVVRLTDANGNGIAGRAITWTAGQGVVSPAGATTDIGGRAATQWTLGTGAGAQTVTATSPGLAGGPVQFTATAIPGAATTITRISGDHQAGLPGAILPESLVVRLSDVHGNGVSGRTITWTTGSGSITPGNTVSDVGGRAAARWTLGSGAGPQSATAVTGSLQASFTATVTPAPQTMHLVFSTYIGGNQEDQVRDIAVDRSGFIYVVGGTASSNFRTTPGAFDRTENGNYDVYVAKLSPQGTLVWATLLGGPGYDRAYAVEVDVAGNVYVAGRAGAGFPVTPGAFQTGFRGSPDVMPYGPQDGFLCKLAPNGGSLRFCSYFGTDDLNIIRDIALDNQGSIYLASSHESGNYPSSWFGTGFRTTPSGGADAVIAKVRNDGSRVSWLTFVGGSGDEAGEPSIKVDGQGNVFALYSTESANAPTPNGFDHTLGGVRDYYLFKLPSDGSQLLFATYLGGDQGEDVETHELALDPQGRPVVANGTQSADFPTTPGAFQTAHNGLNDGFVTIIAADGSSIVASTFLGGSGGEKTEGVSVDAQGNIYVTGSTDDPDLPFLAGGHQGTPRGFDDMIIVKLAPDLSSVLYGSYLGGSEKDLGRAGAVTAAGDYVFGGNIVSTNFPVLGAMQPSSGGDLEGAVVKFSPGP